MNKSILMLRKPLLLCGILLLLAATALVFTAAARALATNRPPVANDDFATVHGPTGIPISANDYDPDGQWLWPSIVTAPAHGTVSVSSYQGNSSAYYTPKHGYTGPDSFVYQMCDWGTPNLCDTATVTLDVVNNAPVAISDSFIVPSFGSSPLTPILANDYDPDGDQLSFGGIVTGATYGTVMLSGNPNTHSYQPWNNYTGTDSYTYKICDEYGLCSTTTVYLLVVGDGRAPCAPHASCSRPYDPAGGGASGPSAGDPVDLASGTESYSPAPDLEVYNPYGPRVVWRRNYHGYRALNRYGSPGLPNGWTHPFDVSLKSPNYWGPVVLAYHNGATETMTPVLNSGQPTGILNGPAGSPFLASGVPGASAGQWQSITLRWKDQTEWRFTPLSGGVYVPVQITTRTGQGLTLSWGSSRTLSQVSDLTSGTVLLTFSYGAGGKLTHAADAYGRQVTYNYHAANRTDAGLLESVSQVADAATQNPPPRWSYGYDLVYGNQLSTITVPDPDGGGSSTATINYNSQGKVASLVDANGNQRTYIYNTSNTQVQIKDSAGAVVMSWTQNFDSGGRNTGTTDANNKSTLVEYNDAANPNRPTRVVDRNGKATTYTYDQHGNLLTVTTPRGVTTTYTYDYTAFAPGRLTSVKEGTKPATTFSYYEPEGLLQSVTSPSPTGTGAVTTSYTYDSLGNVLTVTGPGNNAATQITTTLDYTTDGSYTQPAKVGQPLTVTDNLGHTTHMRYDAQGRLTSRKDALGHETNVSYNFAGQLEEVTYPATGQTGTGRGRTVNSYLYPGGPLTGVTLYDESGAQARQVSYGYGSEGELLSISGSTEPVSYTYDALYRLKTLKDGKENTTTYNYDGAGNVSSVQMPGGETIQYPLHDPSGRVLRRIDGNGVTTDYVYDDPENLLTDIQYPATPALNVHFGYDTFGRRNLMTDATGSHAYTYGDLDELKSATTTYTGIPSQVITYAYYPDGSRSLMTTPAGSFSYDYDAAGRMTSLTNPSYETTQWTYFDNNWLHTQQLHAGAITTYTYNGRGQQTRLLNELSGAIISDFDNFTYDGTGNRTSYTASVPGYTSATGIITYEYDAKDQLTREQSTRGAGLDHQFGYDPAGNPTTFKGLAQLFNSNNQRTATGFTHDSNGNPTTYKGDSLSFDAENRLTGYGSALAAGYRGDGLRAWKQSNGSRTYFIYDGIRPVLELTAGQEGEGGVGLTVNTYGAAGLVSRNAGAGELGFSSTSYYTFDPQGSVSRVVSYGFSTIGGGGWMPAVFGATAGEPLTYTAHGEALDGSAEPFGYKARWGYYTDAETGLQLLTHRYYDPQEGRFLTHDPIGYQGGINLYGYIQNNPANYIDTVGLSPTLITGAIGAGLGAVGGAAMAAISGGSLSEVGRQKRTPCVMFTPPVAAA